ncbi:MAG TPA: hypothetical protein VL286_03555 [Rhizomicrobium sp.]|jgi:hypothetical protein|nr:hypothetical protein [Rhizomicrobium sp.]
MSEKAGETARENAEYRCEQCHNIIRLRAGDLIPPCPTCGFDTYDLRNRRFEQGEGAPNPQPEGPPERAREPPRH